MPEFGEFATIIGRRSEMYYANKEIQPYTSIRIGPGSN